MSKPTGEKSEGKNRPIATRIQHRTRQPERTAQVLKERTAQVLKIEMTLKDARDTYYTYSGKLSDVARQLSFAGIAVIWIFRAGDKAAIGFIWDRHLLLPLTLFVGSLTADLFQYAYASLAWAIFHRAKEKAFDRPQQDGKKAPDDFKAHPAINYPTLFFFWSKAVIVMVGHLILLRHLASVLWQ